MGNKEQDPEMGRRLHHSLLVFSTEKGPKFFFSCFEHAVPPGPPWASQEITPEGREERGSRGQEERQRGGVGPQSTWSELCFWPHQSPGLTLTRHPPPLLGFATRPRSWTLSMFQKPWGPFDLTITQRKLMCLTSNRGGMDPSIFLETPHIRAFELHLGVILVWAS